MRCVGMQSVIELKRSLLKSDKIFLFTHLTKAVLGNDFIDYLKENTRPIYIARDPKDALLSFALMKPSRYTDKDDIERFILHKTVYQIETGLFLYESLIHQWKAHVSGWLDCLESPLVIRYENWINNYGAQARLLSEYLGVDVLREKPALHEVAMSRNGCIGDYKNYFSDSLIGRINELCKDEIERIDKYLL